MTHKCFRCEQRFESSGQLVRHMQKDHPTFVQDAKDKIDRSKEQYARTFINTAATCPYCKVDCHTRKKLMKHLEEHKDEPDEETAELKIIRITNESKTSLLDEFNGASASGSATAPVMANNSPTFVQNLIRAAMETDPAKISSAKIKVSSTSLKLLERKYKCFWCDTSFRKRGKLMDHIDMFHKASKDQSELEAGLLQGASSSPQEPEKPKPPNIKHSTSSPTHSTPVFSSPPNVKHGNSLREATTCRSKSSERPAAQHAPPKPKKRSCLFSVVGKLSEHSRRVAETPADTHRVCKFYFGRGGYLPPEKRQPSDSSRASSAAPATDQHVPSQFSPHLLHLRFPSISSSSSQQQVSPQTPMVPTMVPNFQMRDVHTGSNPYSHQSQLAARNQQLAQSLFPHMPYYVPPAELYLNQQHNLVVEQQRSQLQYLSYMQSLVSQSTADPNRPLDLSKAK